MAHTFTHLIIHVIFSTKDRLPQITPDLQPHLFPYMGGIVRDLGGKALLINGVADHVHGLLALPPTVTVADMMRGLKANSSHWVHQKWPQEHSKFGWQTGYGAFSVSQSNVPDVVKYIEGQEAHHRKVSFQDEFVTFLKKHGIAYDERYIWE